jgi:periplasmic divalent cation tolerance protein
MSDDLIVVYVTCPRDQAERLAEIIVESKLAACVNILPARSVYFWQGKLCRDDEALLIIKSRLAIYDALADQIKNIHPYEVPEIVALKAEAVDKNYWGWIKEQT